MRNVIKSTWHCDNLLRISAQNYINNLFEFLGIYQKYLKEKDIELDFSKYYEDKINTTEYHFVNKGVQFVGMILEENNINVSHRNLKRLGRTYFGFPVILTIYADKVLNVVLNYIFKNKLLKDTYIDKVYCDGNSTVKLDFQYTLLNKVYLNKNGCKLYANLKSNIDHMIWR